MKRVLVLGAGFTGTAVIRTARARGLESIGTTRSEERAQLLRATSARVLTAPLLERENIEPLVDRDTGLVIAFPPAAETDGLLAPLAARAHGTVYVSSTGVYGARRGAVDESTEVDASTERARRRLEAEEKWKEHGAVILRCPGIYGKGRGLHLRVARGEARVAGDGSHFISRIHVDDLAEAVVRSLEAELRGLVLVVGDDEPSPQGEVIRWLCQRLGRPMPPSVPLDRVDETLRNDRRVKNARMKSVLGLRLLYPTYREGFARCIDEDGLLRGESTEP